MKMLEDRIRKDGIVREGNVLKVDSFINHQMDIPLFREMAREWKRLFAGKPINKVLTIEASGIGIAAIVASQDYAGILEADQKGAQQMVANTSIKIFMKMQDAEKTWELIRGQAGQSTVLRTTGFNVNEQISSDYRDANSTTVEQEDRVVLRDLQEQIEGEAHFVFSGQIVRGDMFYANPSLKTAQLRVPQLLQLVQGATYENVA